MLEASDRVHLRSLTGLRFFAALSVVIYHLTTKFDALHGSETITGFGYASVSFFFVLSGFVLAWSYRLGTPIRDFYWRRFARVWPLHAVTTVLAIAVASVVGLPISWSSLPWVTTLTQSWVPEPGTFYAFNGVSWSLSDEAFFYLLFPLLFLVIRGQRRVGKFAVLVFVSMVIIGLLVMAIMSRSWVTFLLHILPAYRIGEFIVGISLALAIKRGWRPLFTLTQAVVATAACYALLVIVSFLFLDKPGELPGFMANLGLLPGFAAIIASAASKDLHEGRTCLAGSAPMVRLGQWSFALYLVHELVLNLAMPTWGSADLLPAMLVALLVVVTSIGLAGLLYELVERPVERRLRGLLPRPVVFPPVDSR